MPSTDITLPKEQVPVFPDKCVVCSSKPDSRMKISHHAHHGMLVYFLPMLFLFGWRWTQFPICRHCKPSFLVQRWGRLLLVFIMIWIAFQWGPQVQAWLGVSRKVSYLILGILVTLPYVLAEMFWPRCFNITGVPTETTYEFASEAYAAEFERLNGKGRPDTGLGAGAAPDSGPGSNWDTKKTEIMTRVLGREHDMVMHAIIPYAVGGALDLYYFFRIPGTAIATKEISEKPNEGASNRAYSSYEFVMFTRHKLNMDQAKDPATPFGQAHQNISCILNMMARYSATAKLNPNETCEFPADMEQVGGKCLIFVAYGPTPNPARPGFGVMAIIEIHRSEMDYARQKGGAALLAKLKDAKHYPYSDLDREPVV